MYETIQRWQGERTSPPTQWGQMIEVRGIGQKKLATIREFAETDDPFNVTKLDKLIESVRVDLERLGLPQPTHKAIEVPYERGRDTEVVWIGVGVHRNLRDIFEVNRARTGEELDRATVRHPEKNEWMLLAGYDGTDILSLRFTRFLYPRFKKMLWSLSLHSDVILAHGVKPGFRTAREVYVDKMWVLSP